MGDRRRAAGGGLMVAYCGTPNTLVLQLVDATGNVTQTLDLMDQNNGIRVDSLDVAFPEVRDVVAALPTRDGDYDTTWLFGPRTVTVTGSVLRSTNQGSRAAALAALAGWARPRIRPRLVYSLDGDPPTWLSLRGSKLSGPHSNPTATAFQVSWVAPDPIARGLTQNTVTLSPAVTIGGRAYNLTFPRTYPAGGATGGGTAHNAGTYGAWPLVRFYGPCTAPVLRWISPPPAAETSFGQGNITFTSACVVNAGDYLEVDTLAQTALTNGAGGASRFNQLDFSQTVWAPLYPGDTQLQFAPATFSVPCQCVVLWYDAYI
jgi:hypothetical protein